MSDKKIGLMKGTIAGSRLVTYKVKTGEQRSMIEVLFKVEDGVVPLKLLCDNTERSSGGYLGMTGTDIAVENLIKLGYKGKSIEDLHYKSADEIFSDKEFDVMVRFQADKDGLATEYRDIHYVQYGFKKQEFKPLEIQENFANISKKLDSHFLNKDYKTEEKDEFKGSDIPF